MGKYDKFFELAKKAGIEEAELYINQHRSLNVSFFHGEVDNYSDNNGLTIVARGKVNGKCAAASCDVWDKTKAEFLVKEIAANAKVTENDDPVIIFKGSEKYHKVNTYNKELENIKIDDFLAKCLELEKIIKDYDKRIVDVAEVDFELSDEKTTIINTSGLNLSCKNNYFAYVGVAVASENEQTKSNYDFYVGNDFNAFDVKKLGTKIAKDAVDQLGGTPCESNKYKAVLSPAVVTSLLGPYIGHADAEEVQKHSSLFIDKIGQKIASSKLTIEDRPLAKNVFARWFDDEGVATYNKAIIKNGVLQTYLYTLTTAAKEGRESTGNGYGSASKNARSTFTWIKPGKKTQEELFQAVGNGVYITEVSGLHAGLNPQSGNFSLQSTGYLIKDGKKDRPLDVITVSGNLLEIFNSIVDLGNDVTVSPSGVSCSSIQIKSIAVSGK